jgi:pyridoxamine 5'-phosphate oxidase
MNFNDPPADPVAEIRAWLDEARARTDLPNPDAMTLATIDPDGRPSARIVLLKQVDARGAVFFTNIESRKGRALAANPHAALVLHWDTLKRQLRIEGAVTEVEAETSDAYFATRPRASRIGAWASDQSRPVSGRRELDLRVAKAVARYAIGPIARPPFWGGYRVALERIEFWQGREARLHDRLVYVRDGDAWRTEMLFP